MKEHLSTVRKYYPNALTTDNAIDKQLNIIEGHITDIDYQMNIIEQVLLRNQDRILKAETQIYEATEVIYEAIDNQIDELISKTNYPR